MKKFCDKLTELRRQKGLSQEQLAEYLEVSRQSVSKWEADKTMPEISKLIAIAGLFRVSLDYLLIDDCENRNGIYAGTEAGMDSKAEEINETLKEMKEFIGFRRGFEYKSKASVFGIPLVHVKFGGGNGKVRLADAAKGIIAVGNLAIGVVSAGIFSVGILSLGVLSLGLLFSLGVVSLGAAAVGVAAVGIVAGGISSIGIYATGVAAAGIEIATGMSASGNTAAGMQGFDVSGRNLTVTDSLTAREAVKDFILTYNPGLPGWIADFLTLIYK